MTYKHTRTLQGKTESGQVVIIHEFRVVTEIVGYDGSTIERLGIATLETADGDHLNPVVGEPNVFETLHSRRLIYCNWQPPA